VTARFEVTDAASGAKLIGPAEDAPEDVVVRAFPNVHPHREGGLRTELRLLYVGEGFTLTTVSGQRIYFRRVA